MKDLYTQLKNALNALENSRARIDELERQIHQPIAVIGMACYLPGGIEDPETFWQALIQNHDQIQIVPSDRWNIDHYFSEIPQTPGKMAAKEGGFVDGLENFDAGFFGISPREAMSMDPQQRLVLKSSWRALEHAGIAPKTIRGSDTGVFVGVTNTDYGHSLLKHGEIAELDAYHATGNALNVIAGRLSYFLDVHGPSMAIDTACSSSLVALHNACQSLKRHECTLAICSGVNVVLLPEGNVALSQANMLSPHGKCFTFDERANGYVRSEGCITFLLKRYSDALADSDTILAVIKGSAVNHGGRSGGLTVPNATAQAKLIRQSLKDAGMESNAISYIEAHGTGTSLGDPIEVNALNAVFSATRQADNPLYIGSVKTNIGHLESASGLAGLLKVILSLQHQMLPATKHFQNLNSLIDLNQIPAKVVEVNQPWLSPCAAGVSSFGFSGINTHVIVSSYENKIKSLSSIVERPSHVFAISGKEAAALRAQKELLVDFLTKNPLANLADIAFTYNVGRDHFHYRAAWVAKTREELIKKLQRAELPTTEVEKKPKCAFLMSGQGSQYHGMGKQLYQSSPIFKKYLDECCNVINPLLACSLQEIIFAEQDERLNQTRYTQPAIFVFNYALAKCWESWGIVPDCYIGHSVGEYIAATLAGVMTLSDALKLIVDRASLMQTAPEEGGMLVVMAEKEKIEPILASSNLAVDLAIIAHEHTVLSGKKNDLEKMTAMLRFPTKLLTVSHAFHSALMEPVLDSFKKIVEKIDYKMPLKKVISNLTGEVYGKDTVCAEYWANHMRHAVDLRKSMATLQQENYDVLLEIGPRPTFSGFGQTTPMLYSMRKGEDDWNVMLSSLAELYQQGFSVNWQRFESDYPRQKCLIPGYPFQEKRYWALDKEETLASDCLYHVEFAPRPLPLAEQLIVNDKLFLITADSDVIKSFQNACLEINVESPNRSYQELKESILQEHQKSPFKHLVYVAQAAQSDLLSDVEKQTQAFLAIVQVLINIPNKNFKLWLVTQNLHACDDELALAQSPLAGLRKCLLLETNHIDCIHVDVEKDDFAPYIINEIINDSEEKQIVYQRGHRLIARLQPFKPEVSINDKKNISENACYLITGGQGALAVELIEWYYQQGAKHIVLLSRRAATQETLKRIQDYQKKHCHIECLTIDVADRNSLEQLFSEFGNQRPVLKGLVHAAGIIDDGVIINQSWPRFAAVFEAKVRGAWNLHKLSLLHELDHFVLFSSMASMLGTPGQSSYASANAFLDSLVQHRSHLALPCLTINWGPWGEIGMAKDIQYHADGLTKFSTAEGMKLFSTMMNLQKPQQIMAARIDWQKSFSLSSKKIVFLENFIKPTIETQVASLRKNTLLTLDIDSLCKLSKEHAKDELILKLQTLFKHILRLDVPLLATQNFFELGLDSLMALEIRNNLQNALGERFHLSQTVLFEISTLDALANHIVELLHQSGESTGHEVLSEEVNILSNLDDLSEEDIDKLLAETLDDEILLS